MEKENREVMAENLRSELIMETLQTVCSPLLRLHIFSNGNHLHNRLHDWQSPLGVTRWRTNEEVSKQINKPHLTFLHQNQVLEDSNDQKQCESHLYMAVQKSVQPPALPIAVGKRSCQFHLVLKDEAVSDNREPQRLSWKRDIMSAKPL